MLLLILLILTTGLSTSARGDNVQTSGLSAEARWRQYVPVDSRDAHGHGHSCEQVPSKVIQAANLTQQQEQVVPLICWDDRDTAHATAAPKPQASRKGIPTGVKCHPTDWCDSGGICTEVCERGSVEVDSWLHNAIQTQAELARRLPLCYAALLGTHNSAITLADGFGNRDEYFQQYFRWIKWVSGDAVLRTNDQHLSLTDQLNLGVRAVELDVHWFEGALRIAHCGGLHAAPFNLLVRALNVVAALLGHPIQWDTETVGCEPSLSSLPAADQRAFAEALAELAGWLRAPRNAREFLVVFLDDQRDIATWGYLPLLLAEVAGAFPAGSIYTPADHAARQAASGAGNPSAAWPSLNELVAGGKRVMFVSGQDYGPGMAGLLFSKNSGEVCDWREPPLGSFRAAPECSLDSGAPLHASAPTLGGTLLRVTTCELLYGPFNCGFAWRPDNTPLLDELSLPAVTACAVNMPCPDSLTPERAAAAIWTWAPGHPVGPPPTRPLQLQRWLAGRWSLVRRAAGVWDWLRHGSGGHRGLQDRQEQEQRCAEVSARDGRWRAVSCEAQAGTPAACRSADGSWRLPGGAARRGPGGRQGACPEGSAWDVPHHAKENLALQAALVAAGAPAARLPLQGPDWRLPDTSGMLAAAASTGHASQL